MYYMRACEDIRTFDTPAYPDVPKGFLLSPPPPPPPPSVDSVDP